MLVRQGGGGGVDVVDVVCDVLVAVEVCLSGLTVCALLSGVCDCCHYRPTLTVDGRPFRR